jgi:hypothetical protein
MLAVTGCSGTHLLILQTSTTPRNATTTPPRTPAPTPAPAVSTRSFSAPAVSTRSFSAPGMAISFTYPANFHVVRLAGSKRLAGNTAQARHAAVGIGIYDLLIVSRFPKRPVTVTPQNISRLEPQFDAAVSSALGQRVTSVVRTIGGLPALAYPPAPVVGLPVSAMSRITDVFLGSDEYELNCQSSSKAAAKIIDSACDRMLATLRVTGGAR